MAPDVVVLSYLTKVGRLTGELKQQLIKYLETGYQGELCYLHPDGSFSAFGKSDGSGSTWLTAFVVRIFIQASEFITIDSGVITKALEWLKKLQVRYETISFPADFVKFFDFFFSETRRKLPGSRSSYSFSNARTGY